MKKIRPVGLKVLLEPITSKETAVGGIFIPDTAKSDDPPYNYVVIAVGDAVIDVIEGQTVLVGKYTGTELIYEDKKYKLVEEDEILAIIK